MVNLRQIRDQIIKPALKAIDLSSPEAVDLILFTGIQESGYRYIKQLGPGPALSFWQVEPKTAQGAFDNYLKFRDELKTAVESLMFSGGIEANLVGSLPFAVAMCRIKYRRDKMPLPSVGDGPGMAHIWKQVYNTHLGDGLESEFINSWEKYKGHLE